MRTGVRVDAFVGGKAQALTVSPHEVELVIRCVELSEAAHSDRLVHNALIALRREHPDRAEEVLRNLVSETHRTVRSTISRRLPVELLFKHLIPTRSRKGQST